MSAPRSMRPAEIVWKDNPALPAGAKIAVLLGNPAQPGKFVFRVRAPTGLRVMPHTHPEDRVYTVLSGVFYLGYGEDFDIEKLREFPPGSVAFVPAGRDHFQYSGSSEYVIQVNGIGPTATVYARREDDPRYPTVSS
jgi:quercetin dioxygenase-like cupin family protein